MLARDIARKIDLTEKDRKTIDIKPAPQGLGVTWKEKNVSKTEIEVEFSDTEIGFLQERVKALDKQKKISRAMLNTCIKINEIKLDTKGTPND